MISKIIEIVNNWNPIQIYPLLQDEYYSESKKIEETIVEFKSAESIEEEVFSIFKQSFGEQFTKSIEECQIFANEIMKYKQGN
jgi:hypothetical protein